VAAGLAVAAAGMTACALSPGDEPTSRAQQPISNGVVIRAIYGAGGNTGATWTNDFVLLFNRGSSTVTMSGWSLQYASATGTSWSKVAVDGSLAPGQSWLVQLAGGSNGVALPVSPDQTGGINMGSASGKLALVNSTTLLSCSAGSCATDSSVVDFVGWGTADSYEGSAAAPGHDVTTVTERASNGCKDTDDNAADFTAASSPAITNSSSTATPCGTAPVDSGVTDTSSPDTGVSDTGTPVDSGRADSATGSDAAKVDSGKGDGGYNVDLSPASTCAYRGAPRATGVAAAFSLLAALATVLRRRAGRAP
jgi:hypothetical protein